MLGHKKENTINLFQLISSLNLACKVLNQKHNVDQMIEKVRVAKLVMTVQCTWGVEPFYICVSTISSPWNSSPANKDSVIKSNNHVYLPSRDSNCLHLSVPYLCWSSFTLLMIKNKSKSKYVVEFALWPPFPSVYIQSVVAIQLPLGHRHRLNWTETLLG